MRVAILSQGPCTGRWAPPREGYDLRIGVNSAAAEYAVDWACFADYTGWALVHTAKGIRYFTKHDIATDLQNDAKHTGFLGTWLEYGRPNAIYEADLKPRPPLPEGIPGRIKYSGCYALWLAWHLGATEVECFGVDLGGTRDFLGRPEVSMNCRGPSRWDRERAAWYAMCEAFGRLGTVVRMARMVAWESAKAMHGSDG